MSVTDIFRKWLPPPPPLRVAQANPVAAQNKPRNASEFTRNVGDNVV
jgi:hypothetical protein